MQLINYRIFRKLLDKKLSPPPKKKNANDFIASKECHFLGFLLRKQRKGMKKQRV